VSAAVQGLGCLLACLVCCQLLAVISLRFIASWNGLGDLIVLELCFLLLSTVRASRAAAALDRTGGTCGPLAGPRLERPVRTVAPGTGRPGRRGPLPPATAPRGHLPCFLLLSFPGRGYQSAVRAWSSQVAVRRHGAVVPAGTTWRSALGARFATGIPSAGLRSATVSCGEPSAWAGSVRRSEHRDRLAARRRPKVSASASRWPPVPRGRAPGVPVKRVPKRP
jgi:hypothetical protein